MGPPFLPSTVSSSAAMKARVLLNAAAGSVDSKATSDEIARVADAFRAAGADAVVRAVEPAALEAAVQEAACSDDTVVVGGGDGTLNSGAKVLAGGGRPLGILPLGTLNHFARDLGIPLGLEGAVRTIVAGHARTVDLGEVNGRIFLNNSSIGIYPEVVRERDEIQEHGTASKRRAGLRAAFDQLRRFPMVTVTLRLPERTLRVTTPLVFIGNNRYDMKLFAIGRRPELDRGELWLYVARDRGRLGLLGLVARAFLGRLDPVQDFESEGIPRLEVTTIWRRSLRVALDGEVVRLATPLRYRVHPRALRVLAPPVAA